MIRYKELKPEYDAALAGLIRVSLEARGLNLPGTVYYDKSLDHLSGFYSCPGRAYFVLMRDDNVIGGIGLAEFAGFDHCCELQKLYLEEASQGSGLGYEMITFIETKARGMGYRQMYLETHTNLQAAIHIYERSGYKEIPRPDSVVHSTMNRFYLKKL